MVFFLLGVIVFSFLLYPVLCVGSGQPVFIQYSNHTELKTSQPARLNVGLLVIL